MLKSRRGGLWIVPFQVSEVSASLAQREARNIASALADIAHPLTEKLATAMQSLTPQTEPALASAPTGSGMSPVRQQPSRQLYTPEERKRRDETAWTIVQGVLAPIQFLVFIVSAGLVVRFLMTGEGYDIATLSIVVKTLVLYAIMITGAIWEKVVFDKWLFAPAFYWEDVFSMLVIALHTAYLFALAFGWGSPQDQMILALAAYTTYVINATQFILKLRAARLDAETRARDAGNNEQTA